MACTRYSRSFMSLQLLAQSSENGPHSQEGLRLSPNELLIQLSLLGIGPGLSKMIYEKHSQPAFIWSESLKNHLTGARRQKKRLLASDEEVAGNPTLVWKPVRLWFVTRRRLQGLRRSGWFSKLAHIQLWVGTHAPTQSSWQLKHLAQIPFLGRVWQQWSNSLLGKHLEDTEGKKASFGVSKTLPFHACFYLVIASLLASGTEPASCLPQVTRALNIHKAPLCQSDVIRRAWPAPHAKTAAEPGWPDPELKQDSHAADRGQSGLCEGQIIFRLVPY